ncbi:MAG: DEAD/DEAH box helicase [Pseudomonadota bacterium]
MSDFDMMGLPDALAKRLPDLGLTEPTPIQKQAVPHALNGRDVLGLAQTGTGKTAAFGLPLITRLLEGRGKQKPKVARGLILAPTRELATQIAEVLGKLAGKSLFIQRVVGGVGIGPQIKNLARGTDVLVATPGRLLDLVDRGAVDLKQTRFLVLDEADQMLDLGFIHALRKVAELIGEERQTMLFSATMPKQMNEIAAAFLKSPVRIEVSPPGKAADKIRQVVHFIAKTEKTALLIELLDKHRDDRALVFARTKWGSEKLAKALDKAGFAVEAIHGDRRQNARDRAIKAFKASDLRVLVATDVAARGLDIPDVNHVYNYELPNVPEAYVHRIGRTARAGKDGEAIAFCAPDEMPYLKAIEKAMKAAVEVASGRPWETPASEEVGGKPKRRSRRSGRPGQRPGSKPTGQSGKPGRPRKRR